MKSGKKAKVSDVRNFFPGRVTDRVVRYWLEEDPHSNIGRMPSMVAGIIDRELGEASDNGEMVHWKSTTDKENVLAQCIAAVTRIEPALQRYVLPYDYQVDFGFRTPVMLRAPWGMDRAIINGFMDIIVFDPETATWRIYDVKHTENKAYWKTSFGQLVFYGYENLLRTGQIPVEVGFFQPLVEESVKRFAITEAHINQLAGRVQAMAWELWTDSVAPRMDTSHCSFCEVKHACVKFKPVKSSNGRTTVSLLS
jgi:PD-(D/E)XK nuclease superfamily